MDNFTSKELSVQVLFRRFILRLMNKIWYEFSELFEMFKGFLYPSYINGSIVEYQGEFYIAARKNNRYITISKLILQPNKPEYIAIGEKKIKVSPNRPRKDWVTDPRLFVSMNKLYCSYTYEIYPPRGSRQALAEIDTNGNVLSDRVFNYSNGSHEKNWSFFDHDGEILFVYTVGPDHIVMDMDMKLRGKTEGFQWGYGRPSGGTPPIKIGNKYLSVFHSFIETDKMLPIGALKREYVAGVYCFEAKTPFQICELIKKPILVSELNEKKYHNVVFPCGIVKNNYGFLVSYGYNESEVRIIQFDDGFEPISSGKTVFWKRSIIL